MKRSYSEEGPVEGMSWKDVPIVMQAQEDEHVFE